VAIPAGIVVRPLAAGEFERAAALLALDEEHTTGRPSKLGLSDLAAWLDGVDLDADTWSFEENGELVAFGWHEGVGPVAFAVGVVHPNARGRGLGSALVERGEGRALEAGGTRLHYAALLASRGFHEVRRFFEMTIELAGPPPTPELPDGLRLDVFAEVDARAFYDALDESFQDHWEHHSLPFDEWWARRSGAPDFDPTLWFIVRDGVEVAAVVRNDQNRNGGGWVGALGVRRPWRGRGVGRALLHRTFGEFYDRGVTCVSLGVDAESPTGATRLYESVGMANHLEQVVFEKSLT
jgi:GNAT superfamily N-acetyltransferase